MRYSSIVTIHTIALQISGRGNGNSTLHTREIVQWLISQNGFIDTSRAICPFHGVHLCKLLGRHIAMAIAKVLKLKEHALIV